MVILAPSGLCNNKNNLNLQDNPQEFIQFKNYAEMNINVDEERIADFKLKIKTTGKESKARYEKVVTVLKQKLFKLRELISEYKYEGRDKLEEFKNGFNHEIEIIEKALE
jgi:uncharacterized protein YqeY